MKLPFKIWVYNMFLLRHEAVLTCISLCWQCNFIYIFLKKESVVIPQQSPRNESHGLLLSLITFVLWYQWWINMLMRTLDFTVSVVFQSIPESTSATLRSSHTWFSLVWYVFTYLLLFLIAGGSPPTYTVGFVWSWWEIQMMPCWE